MTRFLVFVLALSLPMGAALAGETIRELRPGVWESQPNGGGATGAAGDRIAQTPTIDVSLAATYGLIPANARTFTAGAGSVTATGRVFTASSGATVFGYGTLQSFRAINYRSGYGVTVRAAAKFAAGVDATWVGVGAFTIGDEISFGYNGEDFGVWHRYGGRPEVQTLTVTGAASGGETATVTLSGTAYNVSLTGGGTVQQDAQEIAAYLETNATGWSAEQIDDAVVVSAQADGDKTDTFSFSSATATASFAETTAGVTKTSNFVNQSAWNGEAYPNFDPTRYNFYQIRYTNGAGPIRFFVMGPRGLRWYLVHTVRWTNAQTIVNLGNPGLHVGCYAASVGATTTTSVDCEYIATFLDGAQGFTRNPRAQSNTKSIATTATNILTVRNLRNYNGFTNQAEVRPFFVTLANDGNKSAVFEVRAGATLGGFPNYQPTGNNLLTVYDTAGTTVTGGRLLVAVTVAKGQSLTIPLTDLGVAIPPSLGLTVSGRMTSGTAADLTASVVWYEDI